MERATTWTSEHGIPVRNLWFLLTHASNLAGLLEAHEGDVDDGAELPEILGSLLAEAVERRLRRGLGRGYVDRTAALTRVRGRIDWLTTQSRLQLSRGQVTCRYQDLTLDRPRNRLARTAVAALAARVAEPSLAARLRALDRDLELRGVESALPRRSELLGDTPTSREPQDRLMVEVAQLALEQILPSEAEGRHAITHLARDEALLRRIFERGVAGFLRHRLHGRDGWTVAAQRSLFWQTSEPTTGIMAVLPGMSADIVMERNGRRLVIDTKFTSMLARNQFARDTLKSEHIYQLYAYVRSQEALGGAASSAEGMLLYPTVDDERSEAVTIDGHRLGFRSIDLRLSNVELGQRLEAMITGVIDGVR